MFKNIRILSIFVLILQTVLSSCVKQEKPILDNTAFNYSTKSNNIYTDLQDISYFEPKDFKLIINVIESLDTAKLNQLETEINSLSTKIQSLASSVNSRLSSLSSQNQSLANHINTITKKF